MYRHSFAFKVKEGFVSAILTEIGQKWMIMQDNMDEWEVTNFSLWNCDTFFFGYYESMEKTPCTKEILMPIADVLGAHATWASDFADDMRLMYEDFGIVRSDKSMIRHRVFMTHLLNGDTEEYKARHDALAAARTEVDPGPDSNFSIWNAGDYIFGYDEIDTSMEHEMTENEKMDTIKWEKHMLDIMEWITDDVDWITDMHHSHVKRIVFKE